jgi:hypothetical protein
MGDESEMGAEARTGVEAEMGAEAATDLSRITEIRDHPIVSSGTATLGRSIAKLEKAPHLSV